MKQVIASASSLLQEAPEALSFRAFPSSISGASGLSVVPAVATPAVTEAADTEAEKPETGAGSATEVGVTGREGSVVPSGATQDVLFFVVSKK